MAYDFDFSGFQPYWGAFGRGLGVTCALAFGSSVVGTIAGIPLGFVLRTPRIAPILLGLNDAVRAVPLLVLILFFYYFPYQDAIGIPAPSAFTVAMVGMTVAQAVFTADVVRSAILNVSKSSLLAAKSLGLSRSDTIRFIILPDVLRQILPAMVAFYIGNIKLSSLASVIGCEDVVFVARLATSQTYRSLEAWLIVTVIYVVLILPLGLLSRRIESSQWLKRR
jgi:His/Glu/Gln/Arg/opine family amino acid ABC transporter permease subunit